MVKKIYLLSASVLLSITLAIVLLCPPFAKASESFQQSYEKPADIATLKVQLNHINTQMVAIKRAWNVERINIKMAEKASSALYNAVKPVLEKILSSEAFTSTMAATVAMQYDEIVNKNGSFRSIKKDNNLSDLFPNLKISEYGTKLYKAMANKAYYLLLGQKLADKVKEIAAQVKNDQPSFAMQDGQEAVGQSVI